MVRVTVHTAGALSPESPPPRFSQNHWKLFLLTESAGSVSFSMDVQEHTDVGLFVARDRGYVKTDSVVRFWYLEPQYSFTPRNIFELIEGKGHLRYKMAEGGVGCRH